MNPIREAESPLEMKELWKLLKDHVTNNYSSIKRAFLVFDDVSFDFVIYLSVQRTVLKLGYP